MFENSFQETIARARQHLPGRRAALMVGVVAAIVTGLIYGPTLALELQSKSWSVKSGELLNKQFITDQGWDVRFLGLVPGKWHYRNDQHAVQVWYRYTVSEVTTTNSLIFRTDESPLGSVSLNLDRLPGVMVYYDPQNPQHSTLIQGVRFRTLWSITWVFAVSFAILCVVVSTINALLNSSREVDELDELRRQQAWRDLK